MNKVLRYAMQGAGYGSVAYLLLLASHLENWPHSSGRIVSVLLMSAAIGILTLVFDSDRLSFLAALGIHFVGTFVLVIGMLSYQGVPTNWPAAGAIWSFGWSYIVIYVGIYAVVRFNQHLRVTKINQALLKRNQSQK
ncbi:DUF3021 domain-containing protein [Lactiplantibacillus mudanjiangensis]|uniref:DUF3021 domain-containing protein n=1 Tax=Lactiplantibacillus mudanjiangensis TaxID=1296538 RepID=A0A660E845_9LACO|nr:DUF3021 domain-containing protein [Lactiplantibacillus mudanjiangensis]VDG19629.1 hypothetical protein [Lactobacillus plantarum subsp. plantarum ST-III] [Lactiplantibacillus mudanjiangensis]VDG28540.1 hypothetical protein [Lactobacillus plantarum subsp. plantarum ST-III] [Lactiplantibacillus mudanjiangensis]VDG31075.1 hypothetical protein [Lactobacillus plantarum subsp. plantarum ST-III] [Lactiplantibacillus mudanjiangensis]